MILRCRRLKCGDALAAVLLRIGVHRQCGRCRERQATMNAWGKEKCLARLDQIVGWLEEAAHDRGLWFERTTAKALVRLALWRCG